MSRYMSGNDGDVVPEQNLTMRKWLEDNLSFDMLC